MHSSSCAVLASARAITVFAVSTCRARQDERAHLGRLLERVNDDGLEPLLAIVERKFVASLTCRRRASGSLAIPIGIAFWVVALDRAGRTPLRACAGASRCSAGLGAVARRRVAREPA